MKNVNIEKILKIWLPALLLALAAVAMPALVRQKTSVSALSARNPAPEVLGAATDLRGTPQTTAEIIQKSVPDTSAVKAQSFLVFNLQTGDELLSKNPGQQRHIASLTKLMTAWVAYHQIDLNTTIQTTKADLLNTKPDLGFGANESILGWDLFNSMLVGSCNDAALALANFVSRISEQNFAELMNAQAKDLGMASSHFSNPMGFDSLYNYSTAADLKKLIMATQQVAAFTNLSRREDYEFTTPSGKFYSVQATNRLLQSNPDLLAIKTGFTNETGGAMATKFIFHGQPLAVLVLGSSDRDGDTLALKKIIQDNFAFSN